MNSSSGGAVPELVSQRSSAFRFDLEGPVATVTLCRPVTSVEPDIDLLAELREWERRLSGDIRIVVVRGEGQTCLAGAHLDDPPPMARMSPSEADAYLAGLHRGLGWLRQPDLISIAAFSGLVMGAGALLALACDFRVFTHDVELALSEMPQGWISGFGVTKRLTELLGYPRFLEICVTGRRIVSAEAERWGLANAVVSAADFDETVNDLVGAVLRTPRDAVIETKALLLAAGRCGVAEQESKERSSVVRQIYAHVGIGE